MTKIEAQRAYITLNIRELFVAEKNSDTRVHEASPGASPRLAHFPWEDTALG